MVIAFAFGAPETIRSNRQIAQIASKKAKELGLPIFTQRDVSIEAGIETLYIYEKHGCPPPTQHIAREAIWWARHRGFKEVWVAAAEPHLKRCLRDLARWSISESELEAEIAIRVCEEIRIYLKNSWFCPDSIQTRTRSLWNWQVRERILFALPYPLYKWIENYKYNKS